MGESQLQRIEAALAQVKPPPGAPRVPRSSLQSCSFEVKNPTVPGTPGTPAAPNLDLIRTTPDDRPPIAPLTMPASPASLSFHIPARSKTTGPAQMPVLPQCPTVPPQVMVRDRPGRDRPGHDRAPQDGVTPDPAVPNPTTLNPATPPLTNPEPGTGDRPLQPTPSTPAPLNREMVAPGSPGARSLAPSPPQPFDRSTPNPGATPPSRPSPSPGLVTPGNTVGQPNAQSQGSTHPHPYTTITVQPFTVATDALKEPSLPRVKTPNFSQHRHSTNPSFAMSLLQDIALVVQQWQLELESIHQQIQGIYMEGPIVDGWLEADTSTEGEVKGYRLCGLNPNGQLWSRPCPPDQLPGLSVAIARYQTLRQTMAQKHRLEVRLKQLGEALAVLRSRL